MPGFSLAECETAYGDEIDMAMRWKSGADLTALAGKPVVLCGWEDNVGKRLPAAVEGNAGKRHLAAWNGTRTKRLEAASPHVPCRRRNDC